MAEFDPVPPPLDLPAVPDVLSPNVPLNPPMVGNASPWIPVDGQNRDLILASIRAWVYRSLLPWTTAWQTQLTDWEGAVETQLDAWMVLAETYITDHAVAGLSFRTTATAIAPTGTTDAVFVVDTDLRPLTVGDLVLTQAASGVYGQITALIDDTHATVTPLGSLLGPSGLSFRTTDTPIAGAGTTNVTVALTAGHPLALNDLIVDSATDSNYGVVTAVLTATTATVTFVGTFKGAPGAAGAPGAPGTPGADGVMTSVVAGAGIAVDSTDPANPIVSATGGIALYANPTVLNAASASDGALATMSLPSAGIDDSLWIRTGGIWRCLYMVLNTNVQDSSTVVDWPAIVATLNLGVNTGLSMVGASITETICGTEPIWDPNLGLFVQDKNANRWLEQSPNTPFAGTWTINPDQTVSLVGVDRWEQRKIAPSLATDNTDEYETRIWGVLAANGSIGLYLTNSTGGRDNAPHYAETSFTYQLNPSTVVLDALGFNKLGDIAGWPVVDDTTGSPIYVDATIRLAHANEPGVATTGWIESKYYDALAMTYMFSRRTELYYYNADRSGNDGLWLTFSQHFTGTFKTRAIA